MNNFRKPHGNGGRRDKGHFGGQGPSRPNFDRGSSSSRFGGGGGFRKERAEMFDTICSSCGKPCQVPFRPSGIKPVYCSDCFNNPRVSRDRNNFQERTAAPIQQFEQPQPQAGNKSMAELERQISSMNTKIDSILRILEAMPRANAPALMAAEKTSPKKKVAKKSRTTKK